MVNSFAMLADMTIDGDVRSSAILDWIESQYKQMMTLKSSCGSNILSLHITQTASECGALQNTSSESVRDLICAKIKGTLRNFVRKVHGNFSHQLHLFLNTHNGYYT